MRHPFDRFAVLAAALAGTIALGPGAARAQDYLSAYGYAAIALDGTKLNLARIDSRNANLYRLDLKGERNILSSSQSSAGLAGLAATMIGPRNEADVRVDAPLALVSVAQAASGDLSGAAPVQGLTESIVNGDYVTAYRSGGFGYVEIVSDAPSIGRLSRGR
jgi:hypothetical protein